MPIVGGPIPQANIFSRPLAPKNPAAVAGAKASAITAPGQGVQQFSRDKSRLFASKKRRKS
jgi:hypothetical protein